MSGNFTERDCGLRPPCRRARNRIARAEPGSPQISPACRTIPEAHFLERRRGECDSAPKRLTGCSLLTTLSADGVLLMIVGRNEFRFFVAFGEFEVGSVLGYLEFGSGAQFTLARF